jgi:hypothetical protein
MKTKLILVLLALLASLFISTTAFANDKITRGTEPGSFYTCTFWYMDYDEYEMYYGIFYSPDNGETLELKTSCTEGDSMFVCGGRLTSDATPGVLYSKSAQHLYITYDDCETWELVGDYVSDQHTSGCTPGEIYKVFTNRDNRNVVLHRSIDFGENFTLVNDSIGGRAEVGIELGEIYFRKSPG